LLQTERIQRILAAPFAPAGRGGTLSWHAILWPIRTESKSEDDRPQLSPEDIKKFTGWTIENSAVAAIAEMAAIACQYKWWKRCDPGAPELNPAKVGRELDMLEQDVKLMSMNA